MSSPRFQRSAAILLAVLLPVFAFAQEKNDKNQKKQDESKRAQYLALAQVVDTAMTQPPADPGAKWANDFSLKAQENKTYVPFTIAVDPGKLNAGTAVVYVRVANKGATPTPPDQKPEQKKDDKNAANAAATMYPFEDLQTVQLKSAAAGEPYSISRAFAVPAGDYDVYVAVAEQTGQPSRDKAALGRNVVVKQTLSVPNYWGTELTTSPVVLAEKIDQLSAPLSPEEQADRPFVLGTMEIIPAKDRSFTKKEELSLIFLVYNVQVNDTGKPDLEVEYRFHQKTGDTEKFFNRTQPQLFNASTLPPQFDVRAGHQVVGGQTIPLASFPEGDYRLEIKVNDKLGTKSVTREVMFTVAP
jgi:hypothetical protein